MINTEKEREELLLKIMEVDFVLLDLRLYLNTHPCCTEGLRHCRHFSNESMRLKKEYEAQFGPLSQTSEVSADYFDWLDTPWPWIRSKEQQCGQSSLTGESSDGLGQTEQGGKR